VKGVAMIEAPRRRLCMRTLVRIIVDGITPE